MSLKNWNSMNKKRVKAYFKYITYIMILVVMGFLLLTSTILLSSYVHREVVTDSMTYNQNGDLNYSICLKENEYLGKKCINEDRSFVTSLIDYAELDLEYLLDSSALADYTYFYTIESVTKATEKDSDKVLYNKSDTLLQESKVVSNTALLKISKKYKVDYQYYNNLIKSFKKDYILSMDATLTINVKLIVNGVKDGIRDTIHKEYTQSLVLPLAEQTISVTKTTDAINTTNEIKEAQYPAKENDLTVILSGVLHNIDVLYIIYLILVILKYFPKHHDFSSMINKILKNYDQFIVKVKKIPDVKNLKIIELKEFKDLLDAKNNLDKPIVFYRSPHDNYAVFMIICEEEVYIYVLEAFENEEKTHEEI